MLIFPKLKEWKICLKWSNLFLNKFDHFRQIKIVKDVTKCHGPICSLQCLVLFQIQKVTNLLASHVFSPFFSSRKLFVSKRLPWGITPITSLASWMYVHYMYNWSNYIGESRWSTLLPITISRSSSSTACISLSTKNTESKRKLCENQVKKSSTRFKDNQKKVRQPKNVEGSSGGIRCLRLLSYWRYAKNWILM